MTDGLNRFVFNSSDAGPDESGRMSPDPDFEVECGYGLDKRHIPDEILWRMFNTGVSFRSLSTILDLAFTTANAENSFYTSTTYLFKKYQSLLEKRESCFKIKIRDDISYDLL